MVEDNDYSIIDSHGNKIWMSGGQIHRVGRPAVFSARGTKSWYVNDIKHRIDGPAVEYNDGGEEWWVNGKLHRLDGPALFTMHYVNEWYIYGNKVTSEVNEWMKEQHVTWPFDEPTQMLFFMKFG